LEAENLENVSQTHEHIPKDTETSALRVIQIGEGTSK